MTKLTMQDLLPYEQYKNLHEKFLKQVIAEKSLRRVMLSPIMTGIFESKLTVFYQIQEMIRLEQITDEVYNDLLPNPNELSMTLFIEIPNQDNLRTFNKSIVGIENHLELSFGNHLIKSYEPSEDEDQEVEYTQSVHYLHFPFAEKNKEAFLNNNPEVKLRVNHPNYQTEIELSRELIKNLQEQLKQR